MGSLRTLHLPRQFSLQVPNATLNSRRLSPVVFTQLRMTSKTSAPAPRFAEGEDQQQLRSETQALQQQGWALDADGIGFTKTFHFKSYFKAVVSSTYQQLALSA